MIGPEQEAILHRAQLRRERIAALRRRRAIAELERQIGFETLWADPRRRASYDHDRRLFYRQRPQLYEPIARTIGRRALLASLSALLATPVLAKTADIPGQKHSHQGPAGNPVATPPGKLGARIDVRDFSTSTRPYRDGGDDAVPIQAAIDYAASIGGATVYLGPGPISLTGSQGSDSPALTWTAPGIVLQGDGPGATVITVRYNPSTDVISLGSVSDNLNATQGGIADLGIGLSTGQSHSAGAAIHSLNGQKHRFDNIHTIGGFYSHFWITGGPNQYIVWVSRCLIDATA